MPAMNDTLTGTTTKNANVGVKVPTSMCVNSESASNEIDESELQNEKQPEQRIGR
jgi:hypothetical protein